MVSYRRPDFPVTAFRDAFGAVIEYGGRWQGGMPPEETYGVDTHPERFAPLHAVANALIDYLTTRYEASAADDPSSAADLLTEPHDVQRAVRVSPATPDAAPLTFVFTTSPGVLVHAGALQDFAFPACGCDACDETAESVADQLERTAIAVAEGRYQESYDAGGSAGFAGGGWAAWPASASPDTGSQESTHRPPRVGFRIVEGDGSFRQGGDWTVLGSAAADRVASGTARLAQLPNGWHPWPIRGAAMSQR